MFCPCEVSTKNHILSNLIKYFEKGKKKAGTSKRELDLNQRPSDFEPFEVIIETTVLY